MKLFFKKKVSTINENGLFMTKKSHLTQKFHLATIEICYFFNAFVSPLR